MKNLSPIWQQRVDEVLQDSEKSRIAAILYHLVLSSVNSPVTRKRTSAEELLWIEATGLVK